MRSGLIELLLIAALLVVIFGHNRFIRLKDAAMVALHNCRRAANRKDSKGSHGKAGT